MRYVGEELPEPLLYVFFMSVALKYKLTFLLFLKMADEQTRSPFNKPSTICAYRKLRLVFKGFPQSTS